MKRKNIWIRLATALILVALLVAGCAGNAAKGIEGTWSDGTNTVVITASTFNVANAAGTLNCTINNLDSSAGHILLTATSSTGLYAFAYPAGTQAYVTYVLNGDTLLMDMQTGSYPATATTSFTRQ